MKILLIKLKNLGDTLLLTPVIRGIKQKYPESHVTAVVRSGTEAMLEGCPDLDEIIASSPLAESRRGGWLNQMRALSSIRAKQYDWVFELTDNSRGRWLTCWSRGTNKCTSAHGWPIPWYFRRNFTALSHQNWHLMHRVEKDYMLIAQFLDLAPDVPPLCYEVADPTARPVEVKEPYAVIHPVSRWKRKAWPAERWIETGRALSELGLSLVISSGPDPEEVNLADEIRSSLGSSAISTGGRLSWRELAQTITKSSLFVGLDTAAMHLAAACQCPVVALFGPSIEHHWHPWKSPYEIVSPGGLLHRNYPAFLYDAEERSMLDIRVDAVLMACRRMLHKSYQTGTLTA